MAERLPLLLASADGGPHAGGWYRLQVALQAPGQRVQRLCLQVEDVGPPCAGEACVMLPPVRADARIQALVRLRMDTDALRLGVPGHAQAAVAADVRLQRIGRLRALAAILGDLAHHAGRGAALRLAAGTLVRMLRGPRAAGDWAYAGYRRQLGAPLEPYAGWLLARALDPPADPRQWPAGGGGPPGAPRVSILLPVYDPPLEWLRACLDSVLAQAYPDWELCIADDASPSPQVRALIEDYGRRDARIRAVFRARNGHIAAASNDALALASGEWVALLDHDDLLAPHALLEMVRAALAHPRWRMLYSDEDKLDTDGRRCDPYFKPDFNHTLLLGQNCIGHLAMYRADLLREVGGFAPGVDGSQDWDLALRCVERLQNDEIGHVPQVLYHWRMHAASSAADPAAKDYATTAAQCAVQAHLQRSGQAAQVEILAPGRLRVRHALPQPAPWVSLIVPTRDRVDLLRPCIDGLLHATDYPALEVLVVDNGSVEAQTRDYLAAIARDPRVRVLRFDAPFNYSAINNFAARQATGSVLGLVNNDIAVIEPGWLREMVAQALRPGVGAVGALLLYPDRRIQHAGVLLGIGGVAAHPWCGWPEHTRGQMDRLQLAQELSAVTGACLVLRRAAFDAVGGLDEALAVAFNDVDLCLRLRVAGYRNVWTPHARLVHAESATRGDDLRPDKRARLQREADFMRQRWGALLDDDPAYNPNLSLDGEAFALAISPRPRARGEYGGGD
ncbi:MAG: glycosyltransferase family 2 protein [Thermomonas haemolytica]